MTPVRHAESGFSLIEMLIAMTVMLIVLAGTAQIMSTAIESENAATQVLDMNDQLRAAMDLIQRDLLQAGQGLPVGRRAGVPHGSALLRIRRPGPAASGACPGVANFPDIQSLPAVSVGHALGPEVNGVCTDLITILAADNLFAMAPVASIASDGSSFVVHNSVSISDNPDVGSDNLRPGDIVMLTKGDASVLVQVTAVAGQTVTLGTGTGVDPLRLNQRDTNLAAPDKFGTINIFKATAPADPNNPVFVSGVMQQGPSLATRVRMVTYFVDNATAAPRLMRQIGGAAPNAVALGVEAFRLTYDLADQNTNPTNVRMNAADLSGTGACPDDGSTPELEACSENQIRKVNVVLSMRSLALRESQLLMHGQSGRSTLYAQVSLRSLAFVDRYQ